MSALTTIMSIAEKASLTVTKIFNTVAVSVKMSEWHTTKPLTKYVECPHCHEHVLVHWGSFMGCGKKCPYCNKVFHAKD